MYCDTDSVIFIQPREGLQLVESGDNLGDMTSELNPHEMISQFVSGGPKDYAYTIMDTRNAINQTKKTVYKVRLITLNYNASQLVNFDVTKDMILNQESTHTLTYTPNKRLSEREN